MLEATCRPGPTREYASLAQAAHRKLIIGAALLLGIALVGGKTHAQGQSEGVEPYIEYKKRIETAQNISPLDNGLFGDSVSLYNGSTTFTVVDIDLPGNNSLPVTLARTLAIDLQPMGSGPAYDTLIRGLGNWQVDVPYIAATYPQHTGWNSDRCSVGSVPSLSHLAAVFHRSEYWHGLAINIPGRGTTTALGMVAQSPKPTNGVQYKLTTTERDMLDCIPMLSGLAGEGFRLTTSTGLKYHFNVGIIRTASRLQKSEFSHNGEVQVFLPRNKYYLLASKIEDVLGNTVNFQYNAAGHPTRIWSSDGREILFSYSSGRLVSAVADGRTWQYEYSANAYSDPNPDLARVILPDTSRWQYAYTGTLKPSTPPPSDSLYLPWCQGLSAGVEQAFTVLATHPSGAQGQFNFNNTRHYRSGVHATECWRSGIPGYEEKFDPLVPYYFDVMSLTSKAISGPGLTPATWTYNYGISPEVMWGTPTEQPAYPCATCTPEKVVVITNPDGTQRRHRFGKMYRFNEARMLGTEVRDESGVVMNAESSVYLSEADAPSQLFHGHFGTVLGHISDPVAAYVRPVVSKTITQQSRNFVWRVDATCGSNGTTYCFDSLARPTKVVKSSAPAP